MSVYTFKGRQKINFKGSQKGSNNSNISTKNNEDSSDTSEGRINQILENDVLDQKFGFERVKDAVERTGFLLNMHSNEIIDEDKKLVACVDFYFIEEDGGRFKIVYPHKPYFYILTKREVMLEVGQYLTKKFSGIIVSIDTIPREDLDMPNHLAGLKQKYMKLSFSNQSDLIKVRKEIMKFVRLHKDREDANVIYTELLTNTLEKSNETESSKSVKDNAMEHIIDIREYDVPYHVRVSIDLKIFCGCWYNIKCKGASIEPPSIRLRSDLIERPEPIVLAFDIETTKQPLKFPDSNTDQVMMISYMIDGQGYLITNRQILSKDIEDFEYTPKPEFEGMFTVWNEIDEEALLRRFFEHIIEIRPHIFVTYNGDFFDWPFVEARANAYGINMKLEIGFSRNKEGVYTSRPATHMDCLCWVKRDSYLPIGSHGLKAVAKAKLRYDPVELDPEEMVPLAASAPQILSNYSVSDAVATYYLYMQYVHPFIFALCTIIPCEPDEVLRKGSGTLCEALLMVEAFHCNIVYPNKEQTVLNKLTDDGHMLHQETYIGGHVESLESGVFRADIPCRFRLNPDGITNLIENVVPTLTHAIEVEEGIPLNQVENFDQIKDDIVSKLDVLRQNPLRNEPPQIYHLDVGAMYPNIILTNRLQPCAMVNDTICAQCNFNNPNADCQRKMEWMWRAEYMPATKNEYHRIQQQLETEKFPPQFPGGPPRAFYQLTKQEQADIEKKRLLIYCRKVYKKQRVTKIEERQTTVCQKENSFYVDTVRAFRDRRYEYKALLKKAKQKSATAVSGGDATAIKSAKNLEILYDSLQLAHKCILNSFYGYVMRRGARWHSMEMAGIVCYTGANIIKKAREIIEQVGRPLELDTDGIWCILPKSFPDNITVTTNMSNREKLTISYPNAVLNAMVKQYFTNDQYYELIDKKKLEYKRTTENSIFFEVDGPYKAMILPASKEEGKKLKKRYAVFNFDGSLAELKGFEVKRRGELQLIKNFQSSVFEAFLQGNTLESCYEAVAQVANYWLDVLFSHGRNMPDSELFDLISENRSMSKKLDEYEGQKSTSISTAKRLAQFLGDQMVKDAGLACKYVISRLPLGAPVTERAIPLAIFQAEEAIQKYYLRKWLKDTSLDSIDIRDILDWNYYIERLGGTIQKIITIPAAMQGVANPVSRVRHPDWLHKRILEKNDQFKQRRITDMFKTRTSKDFEDFAKPLPVSKVPTVTKRKRSPTTHLNQEFCDEDLNKSWREVLGNPPAYTESAIVWITFQKRKWLFQNMQRNTGPQRKKHSNASLAVVRSSVTGTLGDFIQRNQRTILTTPWQIIQIVPTLTPGELKMWILIGSELHQIRLSVPRVFYANLRVPKKADEGALFRKCHRILPRNRAVHNLYMYTISEQLFQEHGKTVYLDQSDPNVEGVYETHITSIFRVFLKLGCTCKLIRSVKNVEHFNLDDLEMVSGSRQPYLIDCSMQQIYLYNHKHPRKPQEMYALFLTPLKKAIILVVDSVRTNIMPNLDKLYQAERRAKEEKSSSDKEFLPPEDVEFEIKIETDVQQVYKHLNKVLQIYKNEGRGPTILVLQTNNDVKGLQTNVGLLNDFPQVQVHVQDISELYNVIDWQTVGSRTLIRHYLNSSHLVEIMTQQSRYLHLPLGNMPSDPALFGSDLFYSRHLTKHNHVLWWSPTDKPDLGGCEENDSRLLTDSQEVISEVCNQSGCYFTVCVELDIDSLAINTLLQAHHVTDVEGINAAVAFETGAGTMSIEQLIGSTNSNSEMTYDETSRCVEALKILRTMATTWMRDISVYRNVYADFQVIHFYRWMKTPNSLLYDPVLLRTLRNLMKKLFLQLVAEFKRLGCIVVFADFNKIVICTKKTTVEDAIAHTEFLVTSIRNKELFHSLEITYRRCWQRLFWLDSANFAGIEGNVTPDAGRCENDTNGTVLMNWHVAEKLPEDHGCRYSFNAIIAGYLRAIDKQLKKNINISKSNIALSQPYQDLTAHDSTLQYAKAMLSGDVTQKLLQITEKLYNRFKDTNVPLEFVKTICHVLELDAGVKETVQHLKSNLLRLIRVGEFSDEAKWENTTTSYILPQIICKACNHCRDIDLARDPNRSEDSWLCPVCSTAYDNTEIEFFLLSVVCKKMLTYNLQDLQCRKCGQIKMDNLAKDCQCAGKYNCLTSKKEILNLLTVFSNLAENFKMSALKETIDFNLKLIY